MSRQVRIVIADDHAPTRAGIRSVLEKDGFDVLTYLQGHRKSLPVILLSGMPVDEIQHEMHRLPNRELPPLFIKPIDPGQLVNVLELQLSGELPGSDSNERV